MCSCGNYVGICSSYIDVFMKSWSFWGSCYMNMFLGYGSYHMQCRDIKISLDNVQIFFRLVQSWFHLYLACLNESLWQGLSYFHISIAAQGVYGHGCNRGRHPIVAWTLAHQLRSHLGNGRNGGLFVFKRDLRRKRDGINSEIELFYWRVRTTPLVLGTK